MHKSFKDRDNWGMKWVFGTKSTNQYNKSKMDKKSQNWSLLSRTSLFSTWNTELFFRGVSKWSVIAHQRENSKRGLCIISPYL